MAQQITLNIENVGIIPSLRKVLNLMEGVTIVKTPKAVVKNRARKLTPYEQSLKDLREGKVTTYKSAEDFYKEMGI